MLVKDKDAFEYRKTHSDEIDEQIKDYCEKGLRKSNSINSVKTRQTAIRVLCGWRKELPDDIVKGIKDPYEFLDSFAAYLLKVKTSPNATRNYVSSVKKWLKNKGFRIDSDEFQDRVELPRQKKITQDVTPTPEQMKLILEHSDLRGKTLETMIVSSGMRIGELLNLRIEDIDFTIHPTAIHLWNTETKTDEERWTFISDEATEFLKLYLKGRKEGYVFLGRDQGEKPDGSSYLRGPISENEHMSYFTADVIFSSALDRARLRKKDVNGRDVFHLHKLRYFFKTYMGPHMDSQYVEAFMGHGNGSMKHLYDELPIQEIAKIYEKGMHAVTILNRTDTRQLKQLKEELEISNKATQKILDHDRTKLAELEAKIKSQDEIISGLMELKEALMDPKVIKLLETIELEEKKEGN
jgi:integrase/recombinase XerD